MQCQYMHETFLWAHIYMSLSRPMAIECLRKMVIYKKTHDVR